MYCRSKVQLYIGNAFQMRCRIKVLWLECGVVRRWCCSNVSSLHFVVFQFFRLVVVQFRVQPSRLSAAIFVLDVVAFICICHWSVDCWHPLSCLGSVDSWHPLRRICPKFLCTSSKISRNFNLCTFVHFFCALLCTSFVHFCALLRKYHVISTYAPFTHKLHQDKMVPNIRISDARNNWDVTLLCRDIVFLTW